MAPMPPSFAFHCDAPFAPASCQARAKPLQLDSHHNLGVPIGGIGAGGINRGPSGGFKRFTLKAGQVDYMSMAGNGFAIRQQPRGGAATARALFDEGPSGWNCNPHGHYAALYPKAWHRYREGDIACTIEQLSPVAPDLDDEMDLPVGAFRVHLQNDGTVETDVSVLASFANLVAWFGHFGTPGYPGGVHGQVNQAFDDHIVMGRKRAGPISEGEGTMALAARGGDISTCAAYDPALDGDTLWSIFLHEGKISTPEKQWTSGGGFSEFAAPDLAACICSTVTLAPGGTRIIDVALAWDFPVISFGQGRQWHRHHTVRWGASGDNAAAIARHALDSVAHWSDAIDTFHQDLNTRLDLDDAATALAINELYFLADGLTVWTAPDGNEPSHFGVIECPDYSLYNTLDLWVYAAATVEALWPQLAASVITDYAQWVPKADHETRRHLKSQARFNRAAVGMLPHDLGAPGADPFANANDYVYQDSTRWKDLNAMFAVTAWRSARSDNALAKTLLDPVCEAMQALAAFDRDGDGMIENDGFPDQTFDNIPLTGISAYCGGLWLAALRATSALCIAAGDKNAARRWQAMSATAEPAFENALWNGRYFRTDSGGQFQDAIFAEQMYGGATARLLGLGDCIDPAKARTALMTVYETCFIDRGKGRGAVAMASDNHSSDLYAPKGEEGLQWDEILIGFNYSLAAQLRAYGLKEQCQTLMAALARELGPERGLMFRTPAAIIPDKPLYRAQMNLRPLGVMALLAG